MSASSGEESLICSKIVSRISVALFTDSCNSTIFVFCSFNIAVEVSGLTVADRKRGEKMPVSIIEQRRKELNISKKDVCNYVGICPKTYYLYTVANKPIPSHKLIKFTEILNCSTDYLLGIKKYTHITITDKTGVLLADIGQNEIIEHEDCKVILS